MFLQALLWPRVVRAPLRLRGRLIRARAAAEKCLSLATDPQRECGPRSIATFARILRNLIRSLNLIAAIKSARLNEMAAAAIKLHEHLLAILRLPKCSSCVFVSLAGGANYAKIARPLDGRSAAAAAAADEEGHADKLVRNSDAPQCERCPTRHGDESSAF